MKLSTRRRRHLIEATVMVVVAGLAVRLLKPATVFNWAKRPSRRMRRFVSDEIGWVSWAVETVGTTWWLRSLCLPKALAAQAMLRRRGIPSRVCLGVARKGDQLTAHAWTEVDDQVVVGGTESQDFTRLSAFGDEGREPTREPA
jgi:hypothetical protein